MQFIRTIIKNQKRQILELQIAVSQFSQTHFQKCFYCILDLYNHNLFHTDIKLENIVLQEVKSTLSKKTQAMQYYLKLIDFASTTNNLVINQGYTCLLYTSPSPRDQA
eukprot:TRINITY_DN32029_c0_g1_i1.p1 TRINITY_DN32029_c0_g1~~TRINITY_DN32029_c0_g1_i1.p1  ORF type:complete len:108 (-),score=15.04 TRINITY_DN32029_c0_g1_i1:49-372(-)